MLAMVSGCAATKGVETRAYVKVKERVDQDMGGGNQGYLYGKPVPEDRSEYKKTRKIYVLEFSKPADGIEGEMVNPAPLPEPTPPPQRRRSEPSLQPAPQEERPEPVVLPPLDSVEPTQRGESPQVPMDFGFEEYVIEKNDTLQKISKKFYNTYRKWGQIYEANKDVIPDPDKIKPGTMIRIPREGPAENLK
jgi:nucleoid-associated protein YgaU